MHNCETKAVGGGGHIEGSQGGEKPNFEFSTFEELKANWLNEYNENYIDLKCVEH